MAEIVKVTNQGPPPLPQWVRERLPGVWVPVGSVWVCETVLKPEQAEYLLDNHNGSNRPTDWGNVKRLASFMKNGQWVMTGETCIIDWNGQIQSFQHRCQGCKASGVPIRVLIVYGVDPEVFKYVDGGKAKTLSDRLAVLGYTSYTKLAASCVRIAGFLQSGRLEPTRPRLTVDETVEMLGTWPSIKESVAFAGTHGRATSCYSGPSMVVALHWIFSRYSRQYAEQMLSATMNHTIPDAFPWTNLKLLAARLHDNKKRCSPYEIAVFSIKSWNSILRNASLGVLKIDQERGEAFPLVHGWPGGYVKDGEDSIPARPAAEPREAA